MTYDLDTPAQGSVLPASPAAATPVATTDSEATVGAFDLNTAVQRFMAGRYWLASGDAVFVQTAERFTQQAGWSANECNEHGDALLHVAVRSGRWASVTWLMEHGADPYLLNNHGHTPVWLARRRPARNLPPVFRQLVETAREQGLLEDPQPTAKPARPMRTPKAKTTPSSATPSVATSSSQPSTARPSKTPAPAREPKPSRPAVATSEEAQRFTQALIEDDRAQMMQLLVEGFDLSTHNQQGNTVLHEALARNAWEWTDRLINYGAPLLARDRQGKTVLDQVEQRWNAQDEALDLDRYETFKDALADEKAAQRVALGQGVTRSTKSLFRDDRATPTIDWKGLPEDPDRPARPTPSGNAAKAPRTGKPHKGGRGVGHPTGQPARARKNGNAPRKNGSGRSGNGGQPNPLVTGLGQGRKSSLDRPLREASDYHVPRGATLAPDVVIVRKVRRTLVKP